MKLKKVAKKVETKKVILLNSGGFDSVCLAHELRNNIEPEAEIHSIFFKYGQNSEGREQECAQKVSDKLGFHHEEYTLDFDWGDNALTSKGNKDRDSVYLPMRNLIFLSYALSYAERIGAEKIYCAFVNECGEYYKDTSPHFVQTMNEVAKPLGVEICAPFIKDYKEILLQSLARYYSIQWEDFHSCCHSNEVGGCGECPDCILLNSIYDEIEGRVAEDIMIDNGFDTQTTDFVDSIVETPITSLKLYINNGCQFNCKHCFIGHQNLKREQLSVEQWKDLIREAKEIGITSIDFFGKEPLLDNKVFDLIKECGDEISTSLITNGVNIPRYIEQIANSGVSVTVSVESVKKKAEFRDTGSHILDVLATLTEYKVPTSVSVDVSNSNYKDIENIIKKCKESGVTSFYFKPLRPFGASEDYMKDKLVSSEKLINLVNILDDCRLRYGVQIKYALSSMDLHRMYTDCKDLFEKTLGYNIFYRQKYTQHGAELDFEMFCLRFKESASITPDGYVLGCASEYAMDDYTLNAFDYLKDGLEECLNKGKESLSMSQYKCIGCYFCKEYSKKNTKIFE